MTQATTKPDKKTTALPLQSFVRGDHVELGKRILQAYRTQSTEPLIFTEGAFYIYEATGKWRVLGEPEIRRLAHAFAGVPLGDSDKARALKIKESDIRGALAVMKAECDRPDFFAQTPPGVLFKNTFIQITRNGIQQQPLLSIWRARFGYDFDYQVAELPTRLIAFLASIFAGDEDGLDRARLIQEFFGVALLGLAPTYNRALVLTDTKGGSGKSTLASIMRAMMPPGSVSSSAPHGWGAPGNPGNYARSELVGKLLNVVTELPATDMENLEAFKAIVSGDPIGARVPSGQPFTLYPRAAHYFSSNALPASRDLTPAFWARVIVVGMTGHFREAGNDPDMSRKVIEDRSLIVPWLIQGAAALVARGKYILPESHNEAVMNWQLESDQVRRFLADECVTTTHPREFKATLTLYNRYQRWSQGEGTGKLSMKKFSQRLEQLGYVRGKTETARVWNIAFANGGVM